MPVTVLLSLEKLCKIDHGQFSTSDSSEILRECCGPILLDEYDKVLVLSLQDHQDTITARSNGFVDSAIEAYNRHHHFRFRPDDVWLTIISHFSLYVHSNAEQFRDRFVTHKGKKELEITSSNADFGQMAREMTEEMKKSILDPELHHWLLPSFSTTTVNDRTIGSILMMATFKDYYTYNFSLLCGLPAVTLLGEKEDWVDLLKRMDRLETFDEVTKQWASLLKPVLSMFVRSYEEPEHSQTKTFWQLIANVEREMSGPSYLAGWITAFTYFDRHGKRPSKVENKGLPTDVIGTDQRLEFDSLYYPQIEMDAIAPSCVQVPVTLHENGHITETTMIAGLMGSRVTDSGLVSDEHDGRHDTIEPVAAWGMVSLKASS